MRTFTTEHTVYTIDELSEDARARAIEDYRQSIWESGLDDLEYEMELKLEELFEQHGITDKGTQLRYSLSYSQGDGASFTGDIEWKAWRATIGTNYWGVRYKHWNSVEISEMTSIKTDKDAPQATEDKLMDIIHEIGKALERFGYDYIECITSDETILENIRANKYEYYSDGRAA